MIQKLIIDIGNTRCKIAHFSGNELLSVESVKSIECSHIDEFCTVNQEVTSVIISSVRHRNETLISHLYKRFDHVVELSHETRLPIGNCYETPTTLGLDRLAAGVGANQQFPKENTLVIDAGSAITIDFVDENNNFLGGNISPGLEMRFRALNDYTERLPRLQESDNQDLIGKKTTDAIINGVQNGLIFEVEGYINHFREKYGEIKVVITGGDAVFFDKRLKNSIFVDKNITLKGLSKILDYNLNT